MRRTLVGLCVIGAALIGAGAGVARMSYGPYYIDELSVSNAIESHGVYYRNRHVAIDNASCLGLRRYGVQPDAYGLDKFHRFKCDLDSADSHFYSVEVSTTTGPRSGYWYTHQISIKKDF